MIDPHDWDARQRRLDALIAGIPRILNKAVDAAIIDDGTWIGPRALAAVVVGFSGGNDSIVLADAMRRFSPYPFSFVHANTGIGVEGTREFVRRQCAEWGIRLIERTPPSGSTYRPAPCRAFQLIAAGGGGAPPGVESARTALAYFVLMTAA